MRIISGSYKGKKLFQPTDSKTRPLKDLTKESIFNLLIHSKFKKFDLEKSIVLDLFSGSGSFGLECLSRKVKHVAFVENYKPAIRTFYKNIQYLNNIKNYDLIEKDIFDIKNAYKKIKSKNLSNKELKMLKFITEWREKTAQKVNIPRNWVITDKLIMQVVKKKELKLEAKETKNKNFNSKIEDFSQFLKINKFI